jgi:hypothetical protein
MMGFGFGNQTSPMRQNAPQERVVNDPFAGMGGATGWQGDWQNRFNQEASRARAPTPGVLTPQSFTDQQYLGSNPDVAAAVSGGAFRSAADHFGQSGFGESRVGSNFDEQTYLDMYPEVAAAVAGGAFSSGADHFGKYQGVFGDLKVNRAMVGGDPGYTPNFSALNAEKDRLNPMAENQIRQQQSFDQMRGFGQDNAVMGQDYTNPGFGQISGQANPYGADMGMGQAVLEGVVDGVSPDFMSGVYDPTAQQATGAYKPPGSTGGLGGLGGIFR